MKTQSPPFEIGLFVCAGESCCGKKGKKLLKSLRKAAKDRKFDKKVHINQTKCLKSCGDGPYVMVHPGEKVLAKVKPADAEAVIETVCGCRKQGKSKS